MLVEVVLLCVCACLRVCVFACVRVCVRACVSTSFEHIPSWPDVWTTGRWSGSVHDRVCLFVSETQL